MTVPAPRGASQDLHRWPVTLGAGTAPAGQADPVPERCDLVVVGAGPAGAAAATAFLRRAPGAHVVLLDRAAFPRDKVCGDAIAAHAFEELARIGVHDAEGDAEPVWDLRLLAPDGSVVVGRCARPNRIIPREVFDARLVAAAVAAGADLVQHRVRQVAVDPWGVTVDDRWRAPVLVAADGASSVVRQRLGIPGPSGRHRAVAVRAYATSGHTGDDAAAQHIEFLAEGWPAYAWSFPLGEGRANIGYGLRTSALEGDGRAVLHGRLAAALPGAVVEQATLRVHPLPLSSGRPVPGCGRVLLAGDAAGLINPLTGEGIFYAIASGRLAAVAADWAGRTGALPGDRYTALLARRFGRHFATTSVLARLLDRRRLLPTAIAAARDPAVFVDVAEIGLGEGTLTPRVVRALGGALSRRGSHM